jgi:putative acetyltransferase
MDALSRGGALDIAPEDPLSADAQALIAAQRAFSTANSPEGSEHSLDAAGLAGAGALFLLARSGGAPVGCGALVRLGPGEGEVKCMHTLAEARGRGVARAVLEALILAAREKGLAALFLETGAQPAFGASRRLYERAGFVPCPPFADYREDPHSAFYRCALG